MSISKTSASSNNSKQAKAEFESFPLRGVAETMSETNAITQLPPAEIDFSKYRKPELAERIGDLVGIPGRLRTMGSCAGLSVIAVLLAVFLLYDPPQHWPSWGSVVFYVYAGFVALVIGLMWGCVVNLTRSVDHSLQLADILLELTQSVSRDVADLREGNAKLPGPRELTGAVHDHVFLPVLQTVVHRQARWLGRPTYWVYRYSIGRVVRRLLRLLPEAADPESVVATTAELDAAQESADRASTWLQLARDTLRQYGAKLQRVIVVPLWTVFAAACALGLAPLAIAWYLTLPKN